MIAKPKHGQKTVGKKLLTQGNKHSQLTVEKE